MISLTPLQNLEARGLIASVQEMIKGAMPGVLTVTSRLYLKRFQPRVLPQLEGDVEAQEVLDALAACPNQTAVESDLKVRCQSKLSRYSAKPECMRPAIPFQSSESTFETVPVWPFTLRLCQYFLGHGKFDTAAPPCKQHT